jgi:hypothetical protein
VTDAGPLEGGGERLIYRRTVDGKVMEAIVLVKPDGKLIMATYGAAKAG